MTMKFGFGQALTRKEDDVLLRGAGRYVADVAPEATLHAVMLRSPHAHARFSVHDLSRVRSMPGVRLVLVAADIAELGPLPTPGVLPGVDIKVPVYPILAKDVVRHVGDAIAFVVADSVAAAKDAAEAITVDWQPLPHVIGAEAALTPGAPQVWNDRPGNLAFETEAGDAQATRAAFAQAAKTVSLTIINQRLVTNYMDTRGVIAEFDGKRITLTLGSQGSHIIRDIICNDVLRIPPDRMRVITPDVGGGFGTKLFPYREYALAAVAAERLHKPVKWVADRSEHFLGDSHGRDNISSARLALDDNGKFLALELDIIADMGAYLSCYGPYIPWLGVGMATGAYDIPAVHVRLRAAYTNTVPVDAYRGAGRPEASYLIERLVDAAARDLDIAPDALRRKNLIKPKAMPYTTPTGKVYDSGDFAGVMAHAQEIADWQGFNKRAAASKRAGTLHGIGMATYIEACGNNGPETANVQLDRDGGVTVLIGSQSTGQGHATSYAQLVAERLDLAPESVRVEQADTDAIATGAGTGAGRDRVGVALHNAHALRRQIEPLGHKLRVGCGVALPGRLRADQHRNAAVAVELDIRRFRSVIAAGFDVRRHADAAQLSGALRCRGAFVETFPVGDLLRMRHNTGEIARVVNLAGRCRVGHRFRLDEVLAPQRVRRDVEIARRRIDQSLDQIGCFRPPRAAVGIDRYRVGVSRA